MPSDCEHMLNKKTIWPAAYEMTLNLGSRNGTQLAPFSPVDINPIL